MLACSPLLPALPICTPRGSGRGDLRWRSQPFRRISASSRHNPLRLHLGPVKRAERGGDRGGDHPSFWGGPADKNTRRVPSVWHPSECSRRAARRSSSLLGRRTRPCKWGRRLAICCERLRFSCTSGGGGFPARRNSATLEASRDSPSTSRFSSRSCLGRVRTSREEGVGSSGRSRRSSRLP